jgi:spermidine/putrescine transport system permease protein
MLGNLIGMQFQGSRNWPFGAALATILMAVTLVALFIIASRAAREDA